LDLCAEFPSLSWLAKTQEKALSGIRETVQQVIRDNAIYRRAHPGAFNNPKIFRKFTVRVPAGSA